MIISAFQRPASYGQGNPAMHYPTIQFQGKTLPILHQQMSEQLEGSQAFQGLCLLLGTSEDYLTSSGALSYKYFQFLQSLERNGQLGSAEKALDGLDVFMKKQTEATLTAFLQTVLSTKSDATIEVLDETLVKRYQAQIWDNFRADEGVKALPKTLQGLALRALIALRSTPQSNSRATDVQLLISQLPNLDEFDKAKLLEVSILELIYR